MIWNHRHLLHALREFEQFYNTHRPHQGIANASPCTPYPRRSTILSRSAVSTYDDAIDSAGSFTNTDMAHDLRG